MLDVRPRACQPRRRVYRAFRTMALHKSRQFFQPISETDPPANGAVPSERIQIGDEYYILAAALAPGQRRELLNHADSFAIFDPIGDIPLAGFEAYGLFHCDTRFLSRFELKLNGDFPVLLSTPASDDGSELGSHLSNTDEQHNGEIMLLRDTVALERSKTLLHDTLSERLRLHNYGAQRLQVGLGLTFEADFADIFETRGLQRSQHGELDAPLVDDQHVRITYRGLDGVERETILTFTPPPHRLTANRAEFRFDL